MPPSCTSTQYDALGRAVQVKSPDGAVTCSSYAGSKATTRDPSNTWRSVERDAVGRITEVIENPTGATCSDGTTTYLDHLKLVCQGGVLAWSNCTGGRQRKFDYDSLGRLTMSDNPESGRTSYAIFDAQGEALTGYDGNGNLLSRKDASGVMTSYGYDDLNRVVSKSYSGGGIEAHSAKFCYDGRSSGECAGAPAAMNGIGRLTFTKALVGNAAVSTTAYSYDSMGRPASSRQTTGSDYTTRYGYNQAGGLETLTYPVTNRTVKTCYDAGLPISVSGGQTGYASIRPGQYAPNGMPAEVKYSNDEITETTVWSALRLQAHLGGMRFSPAAYVLHSFGGLLTMLNTPRFSGSHRGEPAQR